MEILIQVIGIIAMIVGAISLAQKNTKTVIVIQIISTGLFGIHYFLLGAYAGAALNILSLLRNLVIRQKHKKWANPKIWYPVTVLAFAVAVFLSGDGLIGILPLAGCIFMSTGLYIDDGKIARRVIVCSSPCWLIYNIANKTIGGVAAEVINMCSLIYAFLRYDIKKQNEDNLKA